MTGKKLAIVTYGCQMNKYDSERIVGLLRQDEYELTEDVRQALSRIPAPCCSDNSAYTCCCPCNMAKTWWGLSHHLIANEGYDADEVQAAVEEWIEFINPKGFSGNACYTGGCPRPFHRNGWRRHVYG